MEEFVGSILKLAFLGVNTVALAPIVVAAAAVDENLAYGVCRLWAHLNVWASGADLASTRESPLDADAAYVFMSNHRSYFDVPVVIESLAEFQLRWVAKQELASVPFFGWALRQAGNIIIDRSDTIQAVRTLRAARDKMAEGVSVMIFPEGTRASAEQTLLPLKKGGFMLAMETGFPIVPVVVRGSGAVLPKDSWWVRPGEVEVIVGAPIPVAGRTREELMRDTEAFMLAHLATPERRTDARREAV